MKRKILTTLLSLLSLIACVLTFVACNSKTGSTDHSHNYRWVDNGDGTHKQHCSIAGCDNPDINVGRHDFSNGNCVCGKIKPTQDNDTPTHTNHNYTTTVTKPTCTDKGYTTYSCECGDSFTDDIVDALGHSFTLWTSNDMSHWHKCANCGVENTDVNPHVFSGESCVECHYDRTAKGLIYTLNSKGDAYSVTGIGSFDGKDLYIPSTYNELPITVIEKGVFSNTNITTLTMSDNIIVINDNAFKNCTKLEDVYLSASLVEIGVDSFLDCPIKNVTMPIIAIDYIPQTYLVTLEINGGSEVPEKAFYGVTTLKSIVLGDSITLINEEAFNKCTNIENISISDNIFRIGKDAFGGSSSRTNPFPSKLNFSKYNNAYYIGNDINKYTVLMYFDNDITSCEIHQDTIIVYSYAAANAKNVQFNSITIPDKVVSIGQGAFLLKTLKSVIIGKNVKYIASYAIGSSFYRNIESITIPSGLDFIEENAFDGIADSAYKIIGNAKYIGNSSNPNVVLMGIVDSSSKTPTSFTIPNNTKFIYDSAFYNFRMLANLTIPSTIIGIGYNAFYNCQSLQNLYISNIDAYCKIHLASASSAPFYHTDTSFYSGKLYLNNNLITNVTIPEGVKKLSNVFYGCTNLTKVTLPDSLEEIEDFYGNTFFAKCTALQFNSYGNAYYLGSNNNPYLMLIKVQSTNVTSLAVNSKTKIIGTRALSNNTNTNYTNLTNIELPNSINYIGQQNFVDYDTGEINTSIKYHGTQDEWNRIKKAGFDIVDVDSIVTFLGA